MMVAAVSTSGRQNPKDEPSRRPPLLPDNNGVGVAANLKRPKSRTVQSRYMSPSPSTSSSNSSSLSSTSTSSSTRRFPSPLVSRNLSNTTTPVSGPKRSVSVTDRRRSSAVSRPLTPDLDSKVSSNVGEVSAATKLLVTSTRSLSVSFQGETFSLPVSKTKVAPPSPNLSSLRKGTPERRRSTSSGSTTTPLRGRADYGGADQLENSKPIDQHRWPGRARQGNPLARSLDCSNNNGDRNKVIGSGNVIRTLQQSMIDERRASFDGRLSLDLGNAEPALKAVEQPQDVHNESSLPSDLTASDTDSVSSGSTSGVQECGGSSRIRGVPRGIVVSARFWQETNSRLRRLQDPGSPLSTSPGSKLVVPPKLRKYSSDVPISSPRTMSSPIRGSIRSASPSKLIGSSPSRGMPSPSRVRNVVSTINSNFLETPSVLSFAVDVRRGKVGENRIVDAHLLRLLYNRHLQWRFVNATTEATLLVQKHNAEKTLWNAWITISDLRDTITKKRHRLQLLRQKLKLASILKGQMMSLEDWSSFDKEHSISLLGAIEALKASTLRLPVIGGAHVDIQNLKDAVSSAHGVMQAMASSVGSIFGKVEELNSLVSELAKVAAKEQASLEQCKDFLSMIATMQVKDCSLRTHVIQHNRGSTA
ncbi:QWRF motif-containing protein 2-like [Nicotiana tabacum]|uniref:QWRF motif-containing protein 2-like n=1 Tax=Nicotiana tabacum TaxID=4097 RepID=A0A1S4AK89_TOBAC|nr:QWRF motif-containing protein 2 [Nicotiana tomentosiformis]XP_016477117.1 PREDICTED: QWRF motif-containing protein 2-like [Nicotiana tabacum]